MLEKRGFVIALISELIFIILSIQGLLQLRGFSVKLLEKRNELLNNKVFKVWNETLIYNNIEFGEKTIIIYYASTHYTITENNYLCLPNAPQNKIKNAKYLEDPFQIKEFLPHLVESSLNEINSNVSMGNYAFQGFAFILISIGIWGFFFSHRLDSDVDLIEAVTYTSWFFGAICEYFAWISMIMSIHLMPFVLQTWGECLGDSNYYEIYIDDRSFWLKGWGISISLFFAILFYFTYFGFSISFEDFYEYRSYIATYVFGLAFIFGTIFGIMLWNLGENHSKIGDENAREYIAANNFSWNKLTTSFLFPLALAITIYLFRKQEAPQRYYELDG